MHKDIKPRKNHKIYIQVLRNMTPEQRIMKTFELSKLTRELFIYGLHKRFPDLSEDDIKKLFLECMKKCWKRTY